MKVVIAPDSFKESLSALEAAKAIRDGFQTVFPDADYVLVPVADGGEGTVDALVDATGGHRIYRSVTGPLQTPVEAVFGVTGDLKTAIIEMASAAGLMLVAPAARNPMITTSYGVGELISAALDANVRHIIIGIGGSATNDAGAGMLQALGARLLDASGFDLDRGGGSLANLDKIDLAALDARLAGVRIEVACDVDNPLIGPNGASAIFGPQKGASAEQIAHLDASLARFAEIVERYIGRSVAMVPGAGAAGGLGASLHALLGAELKPGAEIVMNAVHLEDLVASADLVLTGEGRLDGQTVCGKIPIGVANVAKRHAKPTIAIAGCLGQGAEQVFDHGIHAAFSVLSRSCSTEEALAEAAENLHRTARNVAATLKLGRLVGS
ncbi:glycerate kinase [Agrobacterium salinitolerans]|uniref:glycerate kinase n=1 Tax=Agrobacterium salinitolerans TaxID=1183413 RepID=UPI001571E36C|nr:glycerate kinase [Agrobacterium salinitolerans]NTA40390.1 glycerate kinase [Agrobacterium salinitolerans]